MQVALYIGNKLLQCELLLAFVLWWSLSPDGWFGSNSNVWNVNGSDNPGNLNNNNVDNTNAVRPSISHSSGGNNVIINVMVDVIFEKQVYFLRHSLKYLVFISSCLLVSITEK